ncbi:MAG: excisionase family DNA-binding protein [Thioalkalivibrio sp.]
MQLRIAQAARQYGIARSTLYRAIHDGRLSATRAGDGTHRIDSAELSRLWGDAPSAPGAQSDDAQLLEEVQALRVELRELRGEVREIRALPPPQASVTQASRQVLARWLERMARRLSV